MNKKIALVTGGSRGIGRAVCVALAKELNCFVIINYIFNEDAANETLKLIDNQGEIRKFDVTNYDEVQLQINDIIKKYGKIDILINNAGIIKDNLFILMSKEEWHDVIDVSLTGFFNVTQPVLNSMIKSRTKGCIVSISSVAAQICAPAQSNYSAAKAAIIAANKTIAGEIASFGIRMNTIAPGLTQTDLIKNLPYEVMQTKIPMKRIGTPEEIADLVIFLCSDKSSYITGQVFNINGGLN